MRFFFRILVFAFSILVGFPGCTNENSNPSENFVNQLNLISHLKTKLEIQYGKDLIVRTSYYLGPQGTVKKLAKNKISCQNCHLDAGTRPFGNHFLKTHANYPQYRAREGKVLTLADRINNCIERNLNGSPLEFDSREMRALLIYFKWLSMGSKIDGQDSETRLGKIKLLDRAANPIRGKLVFEKHCAECHQTDGQGKLTSDSTTYLYPPLWGPNSYQFGASFSFISRFAKFVKYNMPYGKVDKRPLLSDEEAWDVAAYVNDISVHPRPLSKAINDYPDINEKPFDYPKGPYSDPFSEIQHKFGPFQEIIEYKKRQK